MNFLTLQNSLLAACPPAQEMNNVEIFDCAEDMGQVQKVIFQRLRSGSTQNVIPIGTDAGGSSLLATWAALKAATDSTKIIPSPYLPGMEVEPGEKITYGGGNDTIGGIPITKGRQPTTVDAMILRSKQKTVKDLKGLANEKMGVFLVDEYGRIWGLVDDHANPTSLRPIPVREFFVGDKKVGGKEVADSNKISWNFFPNWSDYLHGIKPTDFDPLEDL